MKEQFPPFERPGPDPKEHYKRKDTTVVQGDEIIYHEMELTNDKGEVIQQIACNPKNN